MNSTGLVAYSVRTELRSMYPAGFGWFAATASASRFSLASLLVAICGSKGFADAAEIFSAKYPLDNVEHPLELVFDPVADHCAEALGACSLEQPGRGLGLLFVFGVASADDLHQVGLASCARAFNGKNEDAIHRVFVGFLRSSEPCPLSVRSCRHTLGYGGRFGVVTPLDAFADGGLELRIEARRAGHLAWCLLCWSPVVTTESSPDPVFPWHLLAWGAPEPTDWVDHSRGDVVPAGQGAAVVSAGGDFSGLARAHLAHRDPVGAQRRVGAGLGLPLSAGACN